MKKDVFLIDFDGTIALNDTTKCLAENIIPEKYKNYVKLFREGKINVRKFVEDLLTSLNITEEEFENTIKKYIVVDSTFEKLVKSNLLFYILSSGTKLNVSSALKTINIELPEKKIIANEIYFENKKIIIRYPYYSEENGMNKSFVINKFKEKGYRTIFVGDGPSDYEACKYADIIFARKDTRLEKILKSQGFSFRIFSDFNDLLKQYQSFYN